MAPGRFTDGGTKRGSTVLSGCLEALAAEEPMTWRHGNAVRVHTRPSKMAGADVEQDGGLIAWRTNPRAISGATS